MTPDQEKLLRECATHLRTISTVLVLLAVGVAGALMLAIAAAADLI